MPTPVRQDEQEGINLLVKTAHELLTHPDVVGSSPDSTIVRNKLRDTWALTSSYIQQRPEQPIPSRSLASKVSFASQQAADLLDGLPTRLRHKWIRLQYNCSATPSKTADLLRELVRRMKDFRR
jgi:hypothetical protein